KHRSVDVGLVSSAQALRADGFGQPAHVGHDAVDDLLLKAVREQVALLVGSAQGRELLAEIRQVATVSGNGKIERDERAIPGLAGHHVPDDLPDGQTAAVRLEEEPEEVPRGPETVILVLE